MKVDQAISLTLVGFSLIPVHYPVDGGCSCRRQKCPSIAKHPILKADWTKAHSNRPDELRAWDKAFRHPKFGLNWGVVTGKPSGVVVLDIDPRHGGFDSLDDLQVKHGKLPDTATVETGSGGLHIYFRDPGGLRNGTNVGGSGIDFRADGGFVVAAGSKHASGRYYDWHDGQDPDTVGFKDAPEWLVKLVYKPPLEASKTPSVGLTQVGEGGRNVWLTSIAGSLRNKGCGYRAIYAALHYANEQCTPPLEREEVELIAKSISRYEITGGNQIL